MPFAPRGGALRCLDHVPGLLPFVGVSVTLVTAAAALLGFVAAGQAMVLAVAAQQLALSTRLVRQVSCGRAGLARGRLAGADHPRVPRSKFVGRPQQERLRRGRRGGALDAAGLFFGTVSGNTQKVAELIGETVGLTPEQIGGVDEEAVAGLDGLIVGAPTWNTGAVEERTMTEWDTWLYKTLPTLNVKGKKVAIFGVGDQEGYMFNFNDAAGELHDCFTEAGAEVVGFTDNDGYNHMDSKAMYNGRFCGLMCDADNQDGMTPARVDAWVSQLKAEGFPF